MASSVQGTWPLALAWQHNNQWVKKQHSVHSPHSCLGMLKETTSLRFELFHEDAVFCLLLPYPRAPHLRSLLVMAPFTVGTNDATLWAFLPFLKNNIASHRAAGQPSWACETCSPEPRGLFLAAHPRPRRGPAAAPTVGIFSKVQAGAGVVDGVEQCRSSSALPASARGGTNRFQEASHLMAWANDKPPRGSDCQKSRCVWSLHPFIWWPPEIGERFMCLIIDFFSLNLVILLVIRKEKYSSRLKSNATLGKDVITRLGD